MNNKPSRGGAKPRMLEPGCEQLGITINNERKFGMYELSASRQVLARRVELPTWLSKYWQSKGKKGPFIIPFDADKSESRGHIYMRPPRDLFPGPAVGIDLEIYKFAKTLPELNVFRFYVYGTNYRLVDIWNIARDNFFRQAKLVETKACFMPQYMVPVVEMTSAMIQRGKPEKDTIAKD